MSRVVTIVSITGETESKHMLRRAQQLLGCYVLLNLIKDIIH
jgi:hypothetical protein